MIRWGIIGAGKIAQRFVKSLAHESIVSFMPLAVEHLQKHNSLRIPIMH